MARQRGWTIATVDGGKLLARAWDPLARRYQSRRFPAGSVGRAAAEAWARERHAAFALGVESLAPSPTARLVRDYIEALRARGRAAEHQRDVARVLVPWAQRVPDLAQVSARRETEAFLAKITEGRSAETYNRKIAHVSAAIAWGIDRGLVSPAMVRWKLERRRAPKRNKATLKVAEMITLLADTADEDWPRFALSLYCGLRIQEAHTARLAGDGGVIEVIGKGDKQRLVPIPGELRERMPAIPLPILGNRQIQRRFGRWLARHGIAVDGRSPHSLRHTWAAWLCASGESLPIVQAWAGHQSIVTTAGYAAQAVAYRDAAMLAPRGEVQVLSCSVRPR